MMGRAPCCEKVGLNRGPWTREEDLRLIQYIKTHGEGCWRTLPKAAGLLRCGKSCRLRWINYLRPDLKRGNITEEEDRIIIKFHAILGNRWSLIAGRLPGRTDNEIKNYWNTHLKKKLRNMGVDPQTHRPIQVNSDSSTSDQWIRSLNLQKITITDAPAIKTVLAAKSMNEIDDERFPASHTIPLNFVNDSHRVSPAMKDMILKEQQSDKGAEDIKQTYCCINTNSSAEGFTIWSDYASPSTINAQRGQLDNRDNNNINNESFVNIVNTDHEALQLQQLCSNVPSSALMNLIENELFWNSEMIPMQQHVKLQVEEEGEDEDTPLVLSESISSDLWEL